MPNTRRRFLNRATLALAAAASACRRAEPTAYAPGSAATPGAPPAFGTAPLAGPEVSVETFAEAEKLVQFPLSPAARETAAGSWRRTLASVYERRTGPRKLALDSSVAPATVWNPTLPELRGAPVRDRFVRSKPTTLALPADDAAIAFAPVTQLSRWIEARQLTSQRLTQYLSRPLYSVSIPSCAA